MAGTINYLIPADSMTLMEQKAARVNALIAGLDVAVSRSLAVGDDANLLRQGKQPKTVDIRPFRNNLDAGTGAVLDWWGTGALLAVGTAYTVFQGVAAPVVPANRVWVFAGMGIETVPNPVSRVDFRIGGAVGNTRATFDLEQLGTQIRLYGFFSEPVIYGPLDVTAVQVLCRIATGLFARIPFDAWVIEIGGQTVA